MAGDIIIKDVLGLGELARVVGRGVGTLYEPTHLKKLAAIREEHIKNANAAASIDGGHLKQLQYTHDEMNLVMQEQPELVKYNPELFDAAQKRFIQREVRRQINIESTVEKSAQYFEDDETVSPGSVEQEWIDRFFDSVQDITDEKLQELWGKVLAGEVKNTGSFSLRAIDTLRNLSQSEAELFRRVSQGALSTPTDTYIYRTSVLLDMVGIDYGDIMALMDIGLINAGETNYRFDINKDIKAIQTIGNKAVVAFSDKPMSIEIKTHAFTKVGSELLSLIDLETVNHDNPYIIALANMMKKQGCTKVTLTDYELLNDEFQTRHSNPVDI